MSATTTTELDLAVAAGRAAVYSLLATGFARPTQQRLQIVGSVLLPAVQALELPDTIDSALRQVESVMPSDLQEVAAGHLALFPPITSQDAPGYETGYRGEGIFQQSTLLADIAGFYRAHGLRAGGDERERLDHIVVELEFMALVARKEFAAERALRLDEADICRETARSFLSDHLSCWAPAFGNRVASVAGDPWYRALGLLLALWVEADAAALGVSPIEMADEPLPQDPPDDGSCGPCPVPAIPGVA
ncbi:MAG: molecular chaperone TorD family protein [Acidimicrobiia bacterium]